MTLGWRRCALCAFPASCCLVGLAAGLLWSAAVWRETQRLWRALINFQLRRRLRAFQISSIGGTPSAHGRVRLHALHYQPFQACVVGEVRYHA